MTLLPNLKILGSIFQSIVTVKVLGFSDLRLKGSNVE